MTTRGRRAGRRRLVRLAPGRVVVVRGGLDLAGARVDAAVRGTDAAVAPALPHRRLASCPPPSRSRASESPSRLRRSQSPATSDSTSPIEPSASRIWSSSRWKNGWTSSGTSLAALPRRRGAGVELARAVRLEERLGEGAADAHRLADRLHLRAERPVGAGELLEGEARELDDDVVERRLEARRRRPRQVVRDLVERVADGEPRRDLRDRVAGRLRRERGRARDARVHLDHAHVAGLAAARELDVRAAGVDADRADDRRRRVAQLLVRLVGQRHLRRDRDRVARVDAHRVEVLDRADDHDVVDPVAHDLELELVPAAHRLLDEHLADRRLREAALDLAAQLLLGVGEAAAVTAERERGPHDGRNRDPVELVERRDDRRRRHLEPAALDRLLELQPVLGALDRVEPRADQLDPELVEDARVARARARG